MKLTICPMCHGKGEHEMALAILPGQPKPEPRTVMCNQCGGRPTALYYLSVFIDTLRDKRFTPEEVRASMEYLLGTQPQAPQGAVTGWVSTNARYPEGAIDVFTFGRGGLRIGMWHGQDRRWFTPASYPIHGVTHWQLLPPTPETPKGQL